MIMRYSILAIALSFALNALAQEATTNRATELKASADAASATLVQLPDKTPVKVLERGGAWIRVEAQGRTGWIRSFHYSPPTVVTQNSQQGGGTLSSIGSSLTSAFSGARQQAAPAPTVATTGIRGLSEEEMKNAKPNPAELAKMQGYAASKDQARQFASRSNLAARSPLAYLDESGKNVPAKN